MVESDFRVEFDKASFASFMRALKAFEPALATSTRRNLRRVGDKTIEDMRAVIASGPGDGSHGVKSGIISGLKTGVATGVRQQGVRLSSSGSGLPASKKAMRRAYNKAAWRHPTFGRGPWVSQKGQPYFGATIKRHEDEMVEAVWQALEEAYEKMVKA